MRTCTTQLLAATLFCAGSGLNWLVLAPPASALQGAPQVLSKQFVSGLTAEQSETLEKPFREMMGAMQELRRTHDVIANDLTDEQKTKFAKMFHEAMEGSMNQGHHGEAHP